MATDDIPELLTMQLIRRHFIPCGKRTLDRWISSGRFPKPDIALGAKVRYWKRDTVKQVVEQWAGENK